MQMAQNLPKPLQGLLGTIHANLLDVTHDDPITAYACLIDYKAHTP